MEDSKNVVPSFRFENEAIRRGYSSVAGVDEAGRGPLAGPVVAAAVILTPSSTDFSEIRDSKVISANKRRRLYQVILENAVTSVGIVEPDEIDRINILQAARKAMAIAIQGLKPLPDYVLIDGPISVELPVTQRCVIRGDKLCVSVAAASIVAKVTRDNLMDQLHRLYPQYGFDCNKGYPTRQHRDAILAYGPSPVHRRSFRGVIQFPQ